MRKSLATRRPLGNEHPRIAILLNNLSLVLQLRGDYVAAEPLAREGLASYSETTTRQWLRV